MAPPKRDRTGQRSGRLTAIEVDEFRNGDYYWKCRCDCGAIVSVAGGKLNGQTKSCGCLARERTIESHTKHGGKGTKMYMRWSAMRQRCNLPTHYAYADYGGRGIQVCERWDSFENFLADMGEPPTQRHSLDRIDNNGDYCPENCRWATKIEQVRNTRNSMYVTIDGITRHVMEWAEITGVRGDTIRQRIKRGIDPKVAVFSPSGTVPRIYRKRVA